MQNVYWPTNKKQLSLANLQSQMRMFHINFNTALKGVVLKFNTKFWDNIQREKQIHKKKGI